MSTASLHLPQELVDSIIDYVADNRPALVSCALVSRSWLHSSRHHLFASIALSPHSSSASSPHHLCQRLYQVLQESPAIVSYIRNLQIVDAGSSSNIPSRQWITNERTLPPLLKLLTHLRQLEFGASSSACPLQWKTLPFMLQNAVCTVLKLPSLNFVRLHSWTFPNLVSLAAVLSSCQNLRGLLLSSVTVDEELDHHPRHSEAPGHTKSVTLPPPPLPLLVRPDHHNTDSMVPELDYELGPDDQLESGSDTVYTRATRPHLEALTLDYVNFGYLGYWLFAPSQSPSPITFANLRELRISHSADPVVVEQILLSIGPSLEYLHLKPGSWDVYPFDLRHNANLKSLRLTLELPETALSWCITLLSSLSPSGFITSTSPSTTPPLPAERDHDDDDLQLTHISFEFWTDLKKLSYSSSTASSSLANSPNRSSPAFLPSSSPPSSSPLSSFLTLGSQLPSSPDTAETTPTTSSEQSSSNQTPPRRRSLPPPQPTWSRLDSILSLLPAPLKQVDVGLFAQSSSPDFVRVKEALGGVQARMRATDELVDVVEGGASAAAAERDTGIIREDGAKHQQNGIVRVYQLGLKSQRSVGRICGPRLRSFEGNN